MSDNTYHVVDVDLTDAEELKPDVHLEVAGAKLDLPNLNNAELPIELVQAILLVKSRPTLSDEETSACMAAFLAYFQAMKPNFIAPMLVIRKGHMEVTRPPPMKGLIRGPSSA